MVGVRFAVVWMPLLSLAELPCCDEMTVLASLKGKLEFKQEVGYMMCCRKMGSGALPRTGSDVIRTGNRLSN